MTQAEAEALSRSQQTAIQSNLPKEGELFLRDIGEGGKRLYTLKNGQVTGLGFQYPTDWGGQTIGQLQNQKNAQYAQQLGIDLNTIKTVNEADFSTYTSRNGIRESIITDPNAFKLLYGGTYGGATTPVPTAESQGVTPGSITPSPVQPANPLATPSGTGTTTDAPVEGAPIQTAGGQTPVTQSNTGQPPQGATLISNPAGLAGLTEDQIWREKTVIPGSNRIFKLASGSSATGAGTSGAKPTGKQATLYGPGGQSQVVDVGTSEASQLQKQGWGLTPGSYKAPLGGTNPDGTEAPKDPYVQQIEDILSAYGIKPPDPSKNPYDTFYEAYKKVYEDLGLTSVKTQITDINKQLKDLADARDEKIRDINDNPWLTEGIRLRQIAKENDKYEDKAKNLNASFNNLSSVFERGVQEAQFVSGKGLEISQNADKMTQDMVFKAIDMAQKAADAKKDDVNFGVIDAEGNYGFIDTKNQTVSPIGGGYSGYVGDSSGVPRGIRNNNPLNIKVPAAGLEEAKARYGDPGLTIDPSPALDGGQFLKFSTPELGKRAAAKLLAGNYGYNNLTVDAALKRWSGGGYGGNIVPDLASRQVGSLDNIELSRVISAMTQAEGSVGNASATSSQYDTSKFTPQFYTSKLGQKTLDNEQQSRTRFETNPTVKAFIETQSKYQSVSAILNAGVGGPGDLAIVYEFMKGLDPTSVVRETEYETARKSGNIFQGVFAKYNGYLKDEGGFLPEQVKQGFLSILEQKLKVASDTYNNYARQARDTAYQQGLNPDHVGFEFEVTPSGGSSANQESNQSITPTPALLDAMKKYSASIPIGKSIYDNASGIKATKVQGGWEISSN